MVPRTESMDGCTVLAPAVKARPTRSLAARLTAQQVSLLRAVLLGEAGYLNHSYRHDRRTGRRTVGAPGQRELSQFAARWATDPLGTIRAMNRAVASIGQEERIQRYLEAALELEILFDHEVYRPDLNRVYQGAPGYIADHFTDIGPAAWSGQAQSRRGLDPIRVDKALLRPHLTAVKRAALAPSATAGEILGACYELMSEGVGEIRGVPEDGVRKALSARYAAEGVGLCRQLAVLLQVYLQEAGIASHIARGSVQLFGLKARHAWNLVSVDEGVALVDVTLPHLDRPFILVGASEGELYLRARALNRTYRPSAAEENEYTISETGAGSRPL